MLEDVRQQVESTVTPLLRGILQDTQLLLRQELVLAKVEIKEDVGRIRGAAIKLGFGLGLGAVASILLSFMVVYALMGLFTELPLWGAFAIVGVVFAAIAGVLVYNAQRRMRSVNVVPERAIETMRENVQWIQRRV